MRINISADMNTHGTYVGLLNQNERVSWKNGVRLGGIQERKLSETCNILSACDVLDDTS